MSYLASRVDFGELVEFAKSKSCTARVFTTTAEQLELARSKVGDAAVAMEGSLRVSKESDQLYYLKRSPLQHLPLSPLQARRVNSALGTKQDAEAWLSPRQRDLAKQVQGVLAGQANGLDGFERPTKLAEMATYEDRLRARLSR